MPSRRIALLALPNPMSADAMPTSVPPCPPHQCILMSVLLFHAYKHFDVSWRPFLRVMAANNK
eukprot:scaffold61792_cov32-Tisochrysis_lutea.AAC.2